uniref:Uncharacterized protein n=1 Tax=Meloidogyne enterolobii TaxID=390850 RepID=A0A6V7UC23_MELEN|nr:unnamed protein product [Meloidogyne enterolobii]
MKMDYSILMDVDRTMIGYLGRLIDQNFRHRCNNRRNSTFNNTINNTLVEEKFKTAAEQETKIVLPVFRKPQMPSFNINGTMENSTIFDWHLQHPIELSEDEMLIITTQRPLIGFPGEPYNFDEEKMEGDK